MPTVRTMNPLVMITGTALNRERSAVDMMHRSACHAHGHGYGHPPVTLYAPLQVLWRHRSW